MSAVYAFNLTTYLLLGQQLKSNLFAIGIGNGVVVMQPPFVPMPSPALMPPVGSSLPEHAGPNHQCSNLTKKIGILDRVLEVGTSLGPV